MKMDSPFISIVTFAFTRVQVISREIAHDLTIERSNNHLSHRYIYHDTPSPNAIYYNNDGPLARAE